MIQIFAVFAHSVFLELAISELERKGISDIYAVPLEARREPPRVFDTIHRADGISFLDIGMVLAFAFATIGASKGFVWAWGPIYCGIIGAVAGLALGVLGKLVLYMIRKKKNRRAATKSEVILIVTCEANQSDNAERVLWDHYALALSKVDPGPQQVPER